jgi:hypothetical protein
MSLVRSDIAERCCLCRPEAAEHPLKLAIHNRKSHNLAEAAFR